MPSDKAIADALGRHRADDHLPIEIDVPLTYQLDKSFCESITEDLGERCSEWSRKVATKALGKSLPDDPGLYIFAYRPATELSFEPNGSFRPVNILYVGQAGGNEESDGTLRKRFTGEYQRYVGEDPHLLWREFANAPKRADLLGRYLTIYPLEFWYACCYEIEALRDLEKRLIHLLNPPLNVQLKPKLRPSRTVPAF